jgi:hypothetical protein
MGLSISLSRCRNQSYDTGNRHRTGLRGCARPGAVASGLRLAPGGASSQPDVPAGVEHPASRASVRPSLRVARRRSGQHLRLRLLRVRAIEEAIEP